MNTITEDVLCSVLRNVASACKVKEWRYDKQKFEAIAQNYFGIIIPFILEGVRDGKEVLSIRLALKLAPTDERFRVSGAVTLMFAREIFMYDVVLKKYDEIQREFSEESQYIIPECYYVCNEYCNEVIAMQDMCGLGFKPYTHQMFLDLEHITVSLKSLSKLHALSFVLKKQDAALYEEISKVCLPLSENTNKRYMDIMIDRLGKALKIFENTEYVPLLNFLKQNCSKLFDAALNKVKMSCICHGDIWKENILFKYKDNTPISACLIDYQTSRISSPAFDTLYLIISSTNTHLRYKHYNILLDLYYQTFEQTLAEAGLKSESVYPRVMFEHDLKIVWPACLITANTALWLSSGLQEEGHVRSKHIWETQEEKDKAVNQYKAVIKAIIDDLTSYGYQLPKHL